jgi:hypothetical protein
LFGRHVANRSKREPRTRQERFSGCGCRIGLDLLCQSEVEDLCLIAIGDKDVRGLDVAVDDPRRMGRLQGVGNLYRETEQTVERNGTAPDRVFECPALQQLQHQEALVAVTGPVADIMYGADVGMVQGRGRSRFTLEALDGGLIVPEVRRKELESDEPSEPKIFGLVHHTHPAAAELFEQTVV